MSFERAVRAALAAEGGYINDPEDPGGETNYGISRRSYPDLDIAALTEAQAIEIYKTDWWDHYGYGRFSYQPLAEKLFSLAVNIGQQRATKLLQEAIARVGIGPVNVESDGALGPRTILAANSATAPEFLLGELKLGAVAYYVSLHRPKYLAGWVTRVLA